MPIKRFVVSGRVQGVFYRVSARRAAIEFDLTGYVRNLPDDTVEVVAHGTRASLGDLESWLWEGPTMANVTEVTIEDLAADDEIEALEDFQIR
jgi:acylphosphatase